MIFRSLAIFRKVHLGLTTGWQEMFDSGFKNEF